MFFLAWNNVRRRRNQSILTVAITTVTVMLFVLVLGVVQVMGKGLELSRERLGADAILIPRYASTESDELLFTALPENIYMPKEVLEEAKELPGIAVLSPQFYAQTLALSCCQPGEEARIVGYDPESDFILKPYLDESNTAPITDEEVILGGNLDDDLVGYRYLVLGESFRVASQLYPTGSGMDSTIFMNMDVVRSLCLSSDVLSADWQEMDPFAYISVIMIRLEEGVDPQAFADAVAQSGIDAKCVLTGATISSMQNQLETVMQVLLAMWAASLIISALALMGRFNALARERKKEIGLLRALGMRKNQVFGLVLAECGMMALMGGVLGSGAALLCMSTVIDFLKDSFLLSPSVWNPALACVCASAGIALAALLGLGSAMVPALKSAGLDPQIAITQGEV